MPVVISCLRKRTLRRACAAAAITVHKGIHHHTLSAARGQPLGKTVVIWQTRRHRNLREDARRCCRLHGLIPPLDKRRIRAVGQTGTVGFERHADDGVGYGGNPVEVICHGGAARLNHQQVEVIIGREHIQQAARHTEFALNGLVGVSNAAHKDAHPGAVFGLAQFGVE